MSKPFVIGIGGGSGSGKTSFLKAVKKGFSDKEVCVFSMDDYYRPREQQKIDEGGITNFDLPYSIDKKLFKKDLEKLIGGQTVLKKEYTFNNDKVKPKTLTFLPAKVILVEGLFVFHYKKIAQLLDLKIFLYAKENLKVIRRIRRDKLERNYPLDDVLYRYEHHVLPAYQKFIHPYKDEADLIVNNNANFEKGLLILKGFIKNKIEEKA